MKDYKPHHSGYIYIRVNIKKYVLKGKQKSSKGFIFKYLEE